MAGALNPTPRVAHSSPSRSTRGRGWSAAAGSTSTASGSSAGVAERFERRIVVPFSPQSQLSGIGERAPGDVLWYRRRFDAPESERLLLHFGAVDYRAQVLVNQTEVARHEGGHTPFTADLSEVVKATGNELVVRVEGPAAQPHIPAASRSSTTNETIFYTPTSGIWQTVWLEPLPVDGLAGLRVRPDLEAGVVELEVDAGGPLEVTASLRGVVVGGWAGPAGTCRIALDPVVAWSPESPQLYDLRIVVRDATGKPVDEVGSYFGLRSVETLDGRFWLNGEPYVQRLVLDQGYFPGGGLLDGHLRRRPQAGHRARQATRVQRRAEAPEGRGPPAGSTGPIASASSSGGRWRTLEPIRPRPSAGFAPSGRRW